MLGFPFHFITRLTRFRIWRFCRRLLSFSFTFNESPGEEQNWTFTSLPVEVLSHILMHIDCHSVLEVRQTCKTLHSVTKSRQLWYNFVAELQTKHGILPPEEGCDEYTVVELEQWVLRRYRAQKVWAGSIQPRFRSHVIQSWGITGPSYHKLVPGGRWLLVGYNSAVMYVLDLHDADPTPRVLYDHRELDRALKDQKLDIDYTLWVDRSRPRLSFRVAGYIRGEDTPQGARNFIYHVELVGHGASATLVARPYALFRDSRPGYKHPRFALNDQHVVEVWGEPEELVGLTLNKEVRVYHYSEAPATAGHLEYPSIKPVVHQFQGVLSTLVEFIHKNMFIVYATSPHLLYLFEIYPHTDGSTPGRSIQLLHTVEVSCYHRSDLRLFPGTSESRLVTLVDYKEIRGVVIPHDKAIPPVAVDLGRRNGDWDFTNCYALGISASLFLDRVNETYGIVTHEWNLTLPVQSMPLLLSNREAPPLPRRLLGFDEDIGRLVFLNEAWNHALLIVDVI